MCAFIRHVVKCRQNVHLKFVVHFFKALSFALTRWSSGSCWNNVSSCAHALQPMYNGVLAHVLFPSKQKQINKLIKTREKIKSVLVKSLTSNSESSNLKFKELCLAFQNFLFDRGIFLDGYGTTVTKKTSKDKLLCDFAANRVEY